LKNYKNKQINFCWTPFGYSYSVPLLQENWINPGPNGRMMWRDRGTWQSVFLIRETMTGMLEIINNLENVSDKLINVRF
jgi:hypothetical protein